MSIIFRMLGIVSLCGVAWGQVTFSNIVVDDQSHSSARVQADLSGDGTFYLEFGSTTSYGWRTDYCYGGNVSGTMRVICSVSGLDQNVLNHARFCQTGFSPPTGCSTDIEITTTAAPTIHPANPTAPTEVSTTYPTIDGTTYPVDADCGDLSTELTSARGADGNLNHEIVIPAGTVCPGRVFFGAKTGSNPDGTGTIVVRSSGTSGNILPPAGSRVTPTLAAGMVTFLHRTIPDTQQASDPATCTPRTYFWDTDEAGTNKYKYCSATNTWSLVSGTSGYAEGTSVPATCTSGTYYYKTDATARQGLYYCTPAKANLFVNLEPRGDGGYTISVPDRSSGTTVTGYRFVGIKAMYADEQFSGNNYFFNTESGANRVIFDRCWCYTGSTDFGGCFVNFAGANVAIIDSYSDIRHRGTGLQNINFNSGAGPLLVRNNYIKGGNIGLFFTDNSATYNPNNIVVQRNHLVFDTRTQDNHADYDGNGVRDNRFLIELKRGKTIKISGNIFEKYAGATTNTHVPGIGITPRAPNASGDFGIFDVDIYANVFRHGSGVFGIVGQEPGDGAQGRNTKLTKRVRVWHNIVYDIDGDTYFAPAGAVNHKRGTMLGFTGGCEDYQAMNNTFYNVKGTAPAMLLFSAPCEGLKIENNFFWLNHGSGGGGDSGGGVRVVADFGDTLPDGTSSASNTSKQRLDKIAMRVGTANYTFRNNVICGGTAGDKATYEANYPTGNFWPGDTTACDPAIDWHAATPSLSSDDWRQFCLNELVSTYQSKSVEGREVGASCAKALEEVGGVYGVGVSALGSTTATVIFMAPTGKLPVARACEVTVSADSFATGTRVTATVNSAIPWAQSADFTGLTANTDYSGIIHCNGTPGTFSFHTKP